MTIKASDRVDEAVIAVHEQDWLSHSYTTIGIATMIITSAHTMRTGCVGSYWRFFVALSSFLVSGERGKSSGSCLYKTHKPIQRRTHCSLASYWKREGRVYRLVCFSVYIPCVRDISTGQSHQSSHCTHVTYLTPHILTTSSFCVCVSVCVCLWMGGWVGALSTRCKTEVY